MNKNLQFTLTKKYNANRLNDIKNKIINKRSTFLRHIFVH